MKRVIKCSSSTSYKDYWAYKEVAENYETSVVTRGDNTEVTIYFDKKSNDVYAKFLIKHFHTDDSKYGDGFLVYNIYDDGSKEDITQELDFTRTLDECIQGCFYYFTSRF